MIGIRTNWHTGEVTLSTFASDFRERQRAGKTTAEEERRAQIQMHDVSVIVWNELMSLCRQYPSLTPSAIENLT